MISIFCVVLTRHGNVCWKHLLIFCSWFVFCSVLFSFFAQSRRLLRVEIDQETPMREYLNGVLTSRIWIMFQIHRGSIPNRRLRNIALSFNRFNVFWTFIWICLYMWTLIRTYCDFAWWHVRYLISFEMFGATELKRYLAVKTYVKFAETFETRKWL